MKKSKTESKWKTMRGSRTKNVPSVKTLLSLQYKIELLPLSEKDGGGFWATIPLLKGCQSDGNTPDEAIHNLRGAQEAWFISAIKNNDPIPLPHKL